MPLWVESSLVTAPGLLKYLHLWVFVTTPAHQGLKCSLPHTREGGEMAEWQFPPS